MSNTPEGLSYTRDHEWIRVDGDTATVGLTDHAQRQLGDVVYVELPRTGATFAASEPFGSVESVKAVSEVFMPVGGTITEVNDSLNDEPDLANTDPYGDGWLVRLKVSDPEQLSALLDATEYEGYIKDEPAD